MEIIFKMNCCITSVTISSSRKKNQLRILMKFTQKMKLIFDQFTKQYQINNIYIISNDRKIHYFIIVVWYSNMFLS